MNNQELEWLAAQQPQRLHTDHQARERALLALVRHSSRPREHGFGVRKLLTARTVGFAAVASTAAVAAAVVLSVSGSLSSDHAARTADGRAHPAVATAHQHGAVKSPLVRLADYVDSSSASTGNATLLARTTSGSSGTVTVYDLYADNGQYYFSPTESGLAGQVSAGHTLGGGQFAREIAAAKLAASGDVQTAGEEMATAPDPSKHIAQTTQPQPLSAGDGSKPGVHPGELTGTLYDNWLWEDSEDALVAGSGDPQVRAGVLQLVATLPDITVTHGTSGGQPTLVLAAGSDEVGPGDSEQITINADTGVPIQIASGPAGGQDATVSYKVSRVTLANLPTGNGSGD